MIHLPASVRVYLCLTACDMRRSFDGLHGWCGSSWSWTRLPDISLCSPAGGAIG